MHLKMVSLTILEFRQFAHACLSVWMDINIRLCQFHVIQALICWGKSKPKKAKKGGKASPHHNLDEPALQELLVLFRQAQRCRDSRAWESQFLTTFNTGVDDLSNKHKCNPNVVKAYFNDNWWGIWLGRVFHCTAFSHSNTEIFHRIYH